MAGAFFDAFNPTLLDLEGQFTENWIHNGIEYPAIAIATLSQENRTMKGGIFFGVTVEITVRKEIMDQSGAQLDDNVSVRGIDSFVIDKIHNDGDDSSIIECSARAIDVWR